MISSLFMSNKICESLLHQTNNNLNNGIVIALCFLFYFVFWIFVLLALCLLGYCLSCLCDNNNKITKSSLLLIGSENKCLRENQGNNNGKEKQRFFCCSCVCCVSVCLFLVAFRARRTRAMRSFERKLLCLQ